MTFADRLVQPSGIDADTVVANAHRHRITEIFQQDEYPGIRSGVRGGIVEGIAGRGEQLMGGIVVQQHGFGRQADRNPIGGPRPQQGTDIGNAPGVRLRIGCADQPAQRSLLLPGEFSQLSCLTTDFTAPPRNQGKHLNGAVVDPS